MDASSFVNVKSVQHGFHSTLNAILDALNRSGLSVVEQIDLSGHIIRHPAGPGRNCVMLLVDSPLLLFEAIALERSAAVFIPLHVVVAGDQRSTQIHWAHPADSIGLRAPRAGRGAVDTLYARVTEALSDA
jgi:uncharacterized protein (DUF302 family)